MKVRLIIRKFSNYGGSERVCYRFANYLYERGLLLEVVCGKSEVSNFPGKIVELGFLKPGRFLKTYSFQKRVTSYLNRQKNKRKTVNFAFSKVLNCHVYQNGGGTHKGFLETSIHAYRGLEGIRKRISRGLNPVNYYNPRLEKEIFQSTNKIIAVSKKVKDEMAKYYGKHLEERIVVIHNGIDTEKFNPETKQKYRNSERRKLNIEKNDYAIGFVSSNFKLKGLEYIIKALPYLESNRKLFVAGGRKPNYYIKLARDLNVEDRVKFLGKISQMERFYSAIDCLVHPSFYDASSNVIAEALSMHVPVLVSQYTGYKDLVVDGENGFLINEISKGRLAQLIEKVSALSADFSANSILSDEEVFSRYLDVAEQSLNQERTLR